MNRRVPAVATWFLDRFGVARQNDALIGDLAEEYQAGKSRAWYWWQALVAIAVGVVRDVRRHKLLALRSIALAWIVDRSFQWFSRNLWMLIPRYGTRVVFHWYDPGSWGQWSPFPAWDQWNPSSQMVFSVGLAYAWAFTWVAIGWLVARIHRKQAAAMVLTVMTWRILLFGWSFCNFLINPPNMYFESFLRAWLTMMPLEVTMVLAGGLLVMGRKEQEQPSPATHGIS